MLLTEDEIIDLFPDTDDGDGDIQYGRAIEAAVLAKLREQKPIGYMDEKTGEVCRANWLKFHARECDIDRFTKPIYANPVPTP